MTKSVERLLETIELNREFLLAVVVHLNDTYLVDERPEQRLPGFPRVIATVKRLREHVRRVLGYDRTLVLHSGDFLGPSRIGKETKGVAMVRLLVELGLDWCVLGNHEFDYDTGPSPDILLARMRGVPFGVTMANVTTNAMTIAPYVHWPNPEQPLVALTGLVSETVYKSFPSAWAFREPSEALPAFIDGARNVPFRVVLTHGTREEDRRLRSTLPSRSFLLGGHDHDIDWTEQDGRLAPLMKNKANLQTVRVLLLFAGGASAWLEVVEKHDEIYKDRCVQAEMTPILHPWLREAHDPFALKFPRDLDAMFAGTTVYDAALFRGALRSVDAAVLRGPDTLLEAFIANTKKYPDFVSSVLVRDDHDAPDRDAQTIVDEYVGADEAAEAVIVRDATLEIPSGFDVRDEAMRRAPTTFGTFVAECVRREGTAELALLNAGSFRTDSVVPAKMRLRDLLDCFLYDSDTAVVVLEFPRAALEQLVHHGKKLVGAGGYPHTSPSVIPVGDPLKVAIATYLVENPKAIDGYDQALASAIGIAKAEVPDYVRQRAIRYLSIVQAVRAKASDVVPVPLGIDATVDNHAEQFIRLGRTLFECGDAIGVRHELFLLVENDAHIDDDPLRAARDALRAWVRALPEVTAVYDAIASSLRDDARLVVLIRRAHERLQKIIGDVESHRMTYSDNRAYASLLDHAATGFAAWNWSPASA